MKNKIILAILILSMIALIFSGCGGGNPVIPPPVEPDDLDIPEPTETISQEIDLSIGGTVEVTDPESIINGVKLIIPPIPSEKRGGKSIANITISYIDDPYSLELPDNRGFLLPPVVINSDVTLDYECILEIPYTEADLNNMGLSSNENIIIYHYNYTSSSWEEVIINKRNFKDKTDFDYIAEEKQIKIFYPPFGLDWVPVQNIDSIYVCSYAEVPPPFDPGFPQPGDLLYRKSNFGIVKDKWLPGHVGIYVGEKAYDGVIPYNVIEALHKKSDGTIIDKVMANYYNPISEFAGEFNTTYMGARQPGQPKFNVLDSNQRKEVVRYAEEMVGKPYAWFETKQFLLGLARGKYVKGMFGDYNCVGLTEAAYESEFVGVNLVSDEDEGNNASDISVRAVFWPIEQYKETEPAEGYTVSGQVTDSQGVEIPDVTLNFELVTFYKNESNDNYYTDSFDEVKTDSEGKWSNSESYNHKRLGREWNVTPQKDGYTFEPSTIKVKENANDINFTSTLVTPETYTIIASAGSNGSISPSGNITVNQGSDQSFTITPDSGYSIYDVLVDGSSVGAVSSRTFTNVTENHTISATFKSSDVISASIISYSPSSKITVNTGQSFTISTSFTNTGNTAAYFYPGVSIWNSNGSLIFTDWGSKKYLSKNQQGSASWSPTINTPGEYWLQFGIWNEAKSELLDKEPSPSQNLIKVTTPSVSLSFTGLTPSQISTSTAPYDAMLSASGSNFNNVNRVSFSWSGAASGSTTWYKGDTDWNNKVTINSDNSMTLQPRVVETNPTWSGTAYWTVTLRDTTGATASKSFTVTYTQLTPQVTGVDPSQPTASPSRQYIDILGNNFASNAQVTLQISSSVYPIPDDRTYFINSARIEVYVGLTDSGNWKVWITNPDGQKSNEYSFYVKP